MGSSIRPPKCSRIGIELVQLVGAGILSKETGSEESGYGKNNEWDRIMREYKEQQQADLLYQLKIKKNESKEGNAK